MDSMDAQMNEQQQKDFMADLFSQPQMDSGGGLDTSFQPSFAYNLNSSPMQDPSRHSIPPMNMGQPAVDFLGHGASTPAAEHPGVSPQVMDQQIRIQQLQQLQALQKQIFEQQMALLHAGGASASNNPPFQPAMQQSSPYLSGLPTPGSSTELHPQRAPMDYVSPMFLGYVDHPPDNSHYAPSIPPSPYEDSPQVARHPGSMSAPAHIAFNSKHVMPSDIDLDISPLTSPWLGAHGAHSNSAQFMHRPSIKRTASPSAEEAQGSSRKRKTNGSLAPKASTSLSRRSPRATKSTNSTPFLSVGLQDGGAQESPSPVDLSMPPPVETSTLAGPSSQHDMTASSMTPVTPAMIMNLGKMTPGTGRASSGASSMHAPKKSEVSTRSKTQKKVAPDTTPTQPALLNPPPPKTSHKAAEQKRRDSMKTTFDDLRLLLPPIPLPTDAEKHMADEVALLPIRPLLPGSLPPRGPPKSGEGPNKGVSKLQLLMCGNEFIRVLRGRVERRDEEIDALREEVGRLRDIAGLRDEELRVNLERDIDAVESAAASSQTYLGLGEDDEDVEE